MEGISKAEADNFIDAAELLTLLQGPQKATRLYEFAGYIHNHEPTDDRCPPSCRQADGLMVWLDAVVTGRLIGDGASQGSTLWRPYREGEPYKQVGSTRHTPQSAIRAQAESDRLDAELGAMTEEDWAEAEREVEAIKAEIREWNKEQGQ